MDDFSKLHLIGSVIVCAGVTANAIAPYPSLLAGVNFALIIGGFAISCANAVHYIGKQATKKMAQKRASMVRILERGFGLLKNASFLILGYQLLSAHGSLFNPILTSMAFYAMQKNFNQEYGYWCCDGIHATNT